LNEQLKIIISAEISKLKENVDKAKSHVKSFKDQVKEASKNVDDNFKNMGTSMANGAKAAAVGLAAAGTALLALGASTQEYRNEQAKLTTAFETAGSSAEQAKTTYNDLFRVLGDSGQATEAASHLAKLTTEEKALSEWTNICQGVYATFGDSLPIESLTEAANETAKTGALTGGLADALNWAGISEEDFQKKLDACNTEAEREQLIRETLNGVYDDAAAKYEENNEQVLKQNEAQAKLQDTLATLGEAVAPIITAFTSFANDALAVVVPYIKQLAETYGPALSDALSVVSDILSTIFGYLVDNWPIVLSVAGVIAGIAAAITLYNTVAAVKAAMAALEVTTVWGLVTAYAAQAAAMIVAIAPYVLIVAAIAAVVAAILWLVEHWEELPEYAKAAWEWIKKTWEKVGSWFNNNVVKPVKNFFGDLWAGIKNIFGNIKGWFTEKFQSAVSGIKNAFSSITGFFSGIWSKIKSIFSNVGTAIANAIKGAVTSAVNQVLSRAVSIINGFISAINFAIGIINKIPGVEIKKLSKLDVPKMAKGGIVDSATLAVIGEQGKEAVVPLENNTEWMDKLATMLNERMGGGNRPVVLTVDGKVFAQTAISTINQQTRQTGRLALNLV
jgi:phage-related protein